TTGILYYEALEEFKKQFILVVLRDVNWNKSKAARVTGHAPEHSGSQPSRVAHRQSCSPQCRTPSAAWHSHTAAEQRRGMILLETNQPFICLRIASKSERRDLPPLPGIVARLRSSTHECPQ